MTPLTGVADVGFDCKTATIRMRRGATLAAAVVEKALRDAGFGMSEFKEGGPPTFPVVRFQLRVEHGELPAATLCAELPKELPAIAGLFVEPDGRATALLRADPKLDEAALTVALRKRDVASAKFESLSWPKSATAYVATLKTNEARDRARGVIEGVDGVLAAFGDRDGASFVLFTKEPCANLETKLREALSRANCELVRVQPRAEAPR